MVVDPADDTQSTTTSATSLSAADSGTPAASAKKRTRTRRRGRGGRSRPVATNGNVSDSSDESKHSQQQQQRRRRQQSAAPKQQVSLAEQEQYLAMDCEMVGVGRYGTKSALARVTIVNWHHDIVYDTFVRPREAVTDYRTFVSGITADDLTHGGAIDFDACRAAVAELVRGKILVGHALKNDMQALALHHPWQQTRDTAKYEPYMKVRADRNDGVLWPRKLSELVTEQLHLSIQTPGQPHSAFEDAVAALQLYQHVRPKWEKIMTYKISKTAAMLQQQQASISLDDVNVAVCRTPTKQQGVATTKQSEASRCDSPTTIMWPMLGA